MIPDFRSEELKSKILSIVKKSGYNFSNDMQLSPAAPEDTV